MDARNKLPIDFTVFAGVNRFGVSDAGGPMYGALVQSLRRLIEAVSDADAPIDVVMEAITGMEATTENLRPHAAATGCPPAGHRWDLPARGHAVLLPIEIDTLTGEGMRGRVTISRAYMGHQGVAHGGAISLLFDEALGVIPMQMDPPARTARLSVTYRASTPVERELEVRVRVIERHGRKVLVHGSLNDGRSCLAEADGLFIQPSPPAA